MMNHLKFNRILWFLAACLGLIASLIGVFNQGVYSQIVSSIWLPGTISQDVITIFASLTLLVLSVITRPGNVKLQIIALSMLSYLFYSYGIFVIEQFYNELYLVYIAIFGLSFWSLVYGLVSLDQKKYQKFQLPKLVKILSIGFLCFIPILFYLLWISQLTPVMRTGDQIEFAYSIYILDMAFILPALLISAWMMIRDQRLGFVLSPILFLKAFTLLFSVGLGGLFKPLYNQTAPMGETMFYLVLSAIFLALAVINLATLRLEELPVNSR